MKVFANDDALEHVCPACGADIGVCCGADRLLGGMVHERRYRLGLSGNPGQGTQPGKYDE